MKQIERPFSLDESSLLNRVVEDALTQQARRATAARWVHGVALWLFFVWALMLIDASWPWGGVGRWLNGGLGLLGLAGVWIYGLGYYSVKTKQTHRDLQERLRITTILEKHHGLSGSPLVNALWMQSTDIKEGALQAKLKQRALEQAEGIAKQTDFYRALKKDGLNRRLIELASVLALWGVAVLGVGRLPVNELLRLALPWQDRPAFSLTRFEVALPSHPLVGGSSPVSYRLEVKLGGQLPEHLKLIVVDQKNQMLDSRTMGFVARNHYQSSLTGLRQSLRFYLQADTGRSKVYTLRVDRPKDGTPRQNLAKPPPTGSVIDSLASDQQSLVWSLNRVLKQSQAAMKKGQQAELDASQIPIALDDAKRVQDSLKQVAQQAQQLQANIAQTFEQQGQVNLSDADQAKLAEWMQAIGQLKTKSIASWQAGLPGASTTRQPTLLRQWLDQVATAAQSDLVLWSGMNHPSGYMGHVTESAGVSSQIDDANDATNIKPSSFLQEGLTIQSERKHAGHDVSSFTDPSRQSPAEYRRMVEKYFERINQDQ